MNAVVLKQGRDKAVRNRHHWIFSGAVHRFPEFEDGDILAVQSGGGELLGHAYFNRKSSIVGRMVSFGDEPPGTAIRASFERALALRSRFFAPAMTNAVRLINAEGDGLPGLVVDRYDDVLVVQVATLGMEKLKPLVLELLTEALRPRAILERSDLPARRDEGLEDSTGVLAGAAVEKVRILNTFAYSGSFSVCAVLGGALRADSVDTSETAMALAEENFELNGIPADKGVFFRGDVFEFLREPALDHDFIILDPPAFAKKRTDVVAACRGYKDINRLAFQRVRTPGLVLTFSCSHFVEESLFRQVVFQAAQEAGRRVRILQRHHQAFDHPVNVYHPETAYLKGFLLYVD
jgi:23S rRNA (cytosine1962-C5)-methyltransferase